MRFLAQLALVFCMAGYAVGKPINPADTANLESSIHSKLDYILESGNVTSQLTEDQLVNLPLAIEKDFGGFKYYIIIDSVRFTPQAAYFNAYASLVYPSTGDRMAFAATNIKFQPGGLAATTSSKLRLVSTEKIEIGKNISLYLIADGQNYVEFDCDGFKSINVKGLFEFSEEMILPAEGKVDKVKAIFEGNFTDLNNIIATLTIDPFRPKKFQDITIEVHEAIIDLSDLKNPSALVFPKGYLEGSEGDVFWSGFYLKHARITLPEKLNEGGGDLHIDAQHLIIDKKGFSGNIGVVNLFGTEDGNLNGWPFSIDSLGIHLVKNQLKGAAFKGQMVVPPFDKETPANYYALIAHDQEQGNTYQFNLQVTEELKASALMAEIQLDRGSSINIIQEDGKLKPEAHFHGFISVKSGNKLNAKKLRFENLHLASEKPYIRSGTWSLTGEGNSSAGKYPIAINNINLSHAEDQMKLTLDVALNLMDSKDKGFSAGTKVSVFAEMEELAIRSGEDVFYERQWSHTRTTISSINLKVVTKTFSLDGKLDFYENNQTYGNGFRGEMDAVFANYNVKAIGQFGKVDGYRYWYVDTMMKFPNGLGTGFGVYGMGGGLAYHMKKEETLLSDVNQFISKTGDDDRKKIGGSRSPMIYKPDKDTGITFKASVIVGVIPKPDPFNGVVSLEMQFFSSGGIKYVQFSGDAYFMKPLEGDVSKAQMYADLDITMDFTNDELHGTLVTYVNVKNAIKGIHEGGKAGVATIHIDATDWYLHVGTPEERIGLNFIGLVKTNAYFMMGTYIHDFPSVTDVIPGTLVNEIRDDLNSFMRDENALATGGGIAFGASFEVNTGRQQVLMFYGQFDAGFGFDLMLRDYGNTRCEGETDLLGINGWYAAGQSWIYVQGEVGISVNLKFIKGDFVIASLGSAAIVQAKLPNPLFLQGFVTGNYNILGGFVKGDFNFKFTIGEECEFVGDGIKAIDLQVIAEMQPQSSEEVDVFIAPQVAFNVPISEIFELPNDEGGTMTAYKIELDHFKIKKGETEIPGQLDWSDDKQTVIFNSHEILPPKSELKAQVKVTWYERIKGSWKVIGGDDSGSEEEELLFRTGEAPDYIPESNVLYSYPTTGMYHFYPKEHSKGYMVLKKGQNYLFEDSESTYEARFIPVGGMQGLRSPLSYSAEKKSVSYNLSDGFINEKSYNIIYVKKPKIKQKVDENVKAITAMVEDAETGSIELETQDIEQYIVLEEEEMLYESIFRTSRFNTFLEKIDASTFRSISRSDDNTNLVRLDLIGDSDEVYDVQEIYGSGSTGPLIQFKAKTDNRWYTDYIHPLIYKDHPISNDIKIDWRNTSPYGIPPLKAIYLFQEKAAPELSSTIIYSGEDNTIGGRFKFAYDLSHYYFLDFKDVQSKAYNKYIDNLSNAPAAAKNLIDNSYTNILLGDYKIEVRYVLPGIQTVTSSKILTIKR